MFHFFRTSFQPPEIIPAGLHFAGTAVLDKALEGLQGFFRAAALPVVLDKIHPDAAIGFRESGVMGPGRFIGLQGIVYPFFKDKT